MQGKKFIKNSLRIPIIDWATSEIFQKVLKNESGFNKEDSLNVYLESEVDYVIDMIKGRYKEFKRNDLLRPFYLKA